MEGYSATFYHETWQAPEKEPRLPFKWTGTSVFKKVKPSAAGASALSYASLSKLTWNEIEHSLNQHLEHLEGALPSAME